MTSIQITREPVFNGRGQRFPYSWLYTVTVPGEAHPFVGKDISWARGIAKKYRHLHHFTVEEQWDRTVTNPARAAGMPGAL